MPDEQPMTNIDPERVAEALAAYTEDRRAVDAANGRLRKHQLYYEKDFGVDAAAIRERYKEGRMTASERQQKYVTEQITRRAVNLWDADSPEDFEALMEQAVSVKAASGAGAEKLAGARAYADGFNSGAKGGAAITDNKYTPGTYEHQQWALGCADGLGENPREAPAMEASNGAAASDEPAAPRKRGRPPGSPNRKTASQLLAENAEKLNGEAEPHPNEPPTRLFDEEDEMPGVAALPE